MDRAEQTAKMVEQRDQGWTLKQIADHHGVSPATVSRRLDLGSRPGKPKAPPRGPMHVSSEASTAEMFAMWVGGATQYEIAEAHGITQSSVSERLRRYREGLADPDRDSLIQRSVEELDLVRRELWQLVNAAPAPAYSHGRPMKTDDGDQVEDHSTRLAAMDRILKVQERLAKFLGLDAPAKAEVLHVEAATDAAKAEAAQALAYLNGGGEGDGPGDGG
jgi:predicted transcriptional regulator